MAKWVVVADSVRCRLYEQELVQSDYCEIKDWVHPESRLHDRDAMTDQPGSDGGAVGQGRHAMPSKTDPKEHEQAVFAREIVEHLENGRKHGAFNHLVLVAPPAFLGKLRSEMSDELGRMLVAEINKDLTKCSANEVQEYVKQAS
jgi:protein required for attachment to host cells